jgi:hypothetical protein
LRKKSRSTVSSPIFSYNLACEIASNCDPTPNVAYRIDLPIESWKGRGRFSRPIVTPSAAIFVSKINTLRHLRGWSQLDAISQRKDRPAQVSPRTAGNVDGLEPRRTSGRRASSRGVAAGRASPDATAKLQMAGRPVRQTLAAAERRGVHRPSIPHEHTENKGRLLRRVLALPLGDHHGAVSRQRALKRKRDRNICLKPRSRRLSFDMYFFLSRDGMPRDRP